MTRKTKKKRDLPERGDMVKVVWNDAWSDDKWQLTADIKRRPEVINTVSHLVDATPDVVILAGSLDKESSTAAEVLVIPVGMIVSMEKLS